MTASPKTTAEVSAEDLLTIYGEPQSRGALIAMLALAYSRGALAAATEAAEAVKGS